MARLFGLLPEGLIHHTVSRTDTLRTIADAYYDDGGEHWPVIFHHNRHFIRDPNVLTPGQIIVIPHIQAHPH